MVKVIFIQKNGDSVAVEAQEGLSLLEVAHINNIDLDGNCGGAVACGTCHVIVDDAWINKITKPTEQEEDVLDIVFGLTTNSRLACQIFTSKETDGIIVTIPAG
jgi:2Fe-2S ferredoxin